MTQLRCRIMVGLVLLLGTAVSEVRGDDDSLVGSRVRVRTGHLGGPQVPHSALRRDGFSVIYLLRFQGLA